MNHKGYFGTAQFDESARMFCGEVEGLRDVITYQGQTVDELIQAFKDSVDDYLAFCAERGEAQEKPVSGKLLLRLPADVHRKVLHEAMDLGQSLNAYIVSRLQGVEPRKTPEARIISRAIGKPLPQSRAAISFKGTQPCATPQTAAGTPRS